MQASNQNYIICIFTTGNFSILLKQVTILKTNPNPKLIKKLNPTDPNGSCKVGRQLCKSYH